MPIIALDGTDGSGKSTACTVLSDWLSIDKKLPVESYFMPGATELGRELRRVVKSKKFPASPVAERLIFMADSAQFIEEKINSGQTREKLIILDRANPCTDLIYGAASGLDLDFVDSLQRAAKTNFICDLYIIFRLPLEIAMQRKIKRANGQGEECRIEEKGLAGARARTWEPVASDGAWEKAALDEVQKRLAAASPPPGKE